MRPLHEVACNTHAGHFVWPGGGWSINLTAIEILPSSKSLAAPIPCSRSHVPATLSFALPFPGLFVFFYFSAFRHISFSMPAYLRSSPRLFLYLSLSLSLSPSLSLALFFSLPLFLPVLFHENVIDTFAAERSLISCLSGMC